jgi:uncharacterized protein (TIGR02611 family)
MPVTCARCPICPAAPARGRGRSPRLTVRERGQAATVSGFGDRARALWERTHHHGKRARAAARRRRSTDLTWRAVVFVIGVVLVVGGVILLPLPGPGWLVIFLGLGVLATEFAWASNLLDRLKDYYERTKDKALAKRRARHSRKGESL